MTPEDVYRRIRNEDRRLAQTEGVAQQLIRSWTGYEATNVGSFGLLLNLPDSDLDLSIGIDSEDRSAILAEVEAQGCRFVAERETRPGTHRLVYRFSVDDTEIDFALMTREDLDLLRPGLTRCRRSMTLNERIEHVFEKQRLRNEGDLASYASYKIAPYAKYCPGFRWSPIED